MAPVFIKLGLDAQQAMMRGADLLADSLAVTLGPAGRCVMIEAQGGGLRAPRITKDGVTVADALEVDGRLEKMGLRLMRRAAQRIGEDIGDGTTTTIVLARALAAEGLKAVATGIDPMSLRRELDAGVADVTSELRRMAKPVQGRWDFERVATISANGEEFLGRMIADAFDTVGADGVVSIEDGEALATTWERVPGLQWDGGYVSPYFMTDAITTECRYDNPLILLTEHILEDHTSLLKVMETAVLARRPLFIVAEAVKGEALQTLTVNKVRKGLRVVAGKGPLFGERRRAMLEDTATVIGGALISEHRGDNLEIIDPAALGGAERIVLTKDRTTIIGGAGKQVNIDRRVEGIRAEQGLESNTPFQEKNLRERLARLTGGVVVVRAGGGSKMEITERRDRAEDAAAAVRAAAVDGILPGGGSSYIHAARKISEGNTTETRAAMRILRTALNAPAAQIAANAGYDGRMVTARLSEEGKVNRGFNALTGDFTDLIKAGVIDPARVVISALEAAMSVAGLFLTIETVIAKPPPPPRPSRADDIPFGPEAKDMTAEEAGEFGLV
jgi:chaperonin GroEL